MQSTSSEVYVDLFTQTEIDLTTQSEIDSILQNDNEIQQFELGDDIEVDLNEFTRDRSNSMTTTSTDGRSSSMTTGTDRCESETPQRMRRKRRAPSADPTDLLYDLISNRKPNPVDFLPPNPTPKDHLDHFFESLASTMRTFPALSVATLKLKISQLVGEEEIALAKQAQSNPMQMQMANSNANANDATDVITVNTNAEFNPGVTEAN